MRNTRVAARRWRASLVTQDKTRIKLELTEDAVRFGKQGFSEFNILQFQDELTNSALTVNQNYAEYLRAVTELRRAQGTLLIERGLTVGPADPLSQWQDHLT